jgi:hypothetical protein
MVMCETDELVCICLRRSFIEQTLPWSLHYDDRTSSRNVFYMVQIDMGGCPRIHHGIVGWNAGWPDPSHQKPDISYKMKDFGLKSVAHCVLLWRVIFP